MNTIVNSITALGEEDIENYELLKSAIIRTIGYYATLLPELLQRPNLPYQRY